MRDWSSLLMTRRNTTRRRRTRYSVAVIITQRFLDCEQLPAMCQAARIDLEPCRELLTDLRPISPSDVGRIVAMVRYAGQSYAVEGP